jgi:hypothetical protein
MTINTASPHGVLRILKEIATGLRFESIPHGNNAYALAGPVRGVVTIHASNADTPWWGLAENVLQRMGAQEVPWAAILLEGDNGHGYVWPAAELQAGIAAGRWTFQDKGGRHFKFQRRRELHGSYRFESAQELLGILRVVLDGVEK